MQELFIYNTLSKKKEKFISVHPKYVGMYVCGPTVYGEAHLGHARPAITFDILFRYLKHIGYKVRYVRNITDVGHLTDEITESGEDKIAKKAKLEKIEPMEVVNFYTNNYHRDMAKLNVLSPSIEPHASGHIIEQIELIKSILEAGFAYEINGSVYFNIDKYNKTNNYGKLSGRVVEELLKTTRDLNSQDEKNNSYDFALWKKADSTHIMKWASPWSDGYPGWHLECTAMGMKYLGTKIDIHGGGLDLLFPHHECEIAQAVAATGEEIVKYWMHNNMITVGGQKMGKSLNNSINLDEFFNGTHKYLKQAFSPMTIRLFIMQAHYRSTVDFSNEALQATEKGFEKLSNAYKLLNKLAISENQDIDIKKIKENCYKALNDDINTPVLIAHIFSTVKIINNINSGTQSINNEGLKDLKDIFSIFVMEILGLEFIEDEKSNDISNDLIKLLLNMRVNAKDNKDYKTSDEIRDNLNKLGVEIKDKRDGFEWEINKKISQ